jgi:anthranilate phosphoribosyltransferase
LGLHRAVVVHGHDGLDEITITGPTRVAEVRHGNVRTYEVTPEEFGMKRSPIEDLAGGDAAANAEIVRRILDGEKSARRDVILLNTAAALVAGGKTDHFGEAVPIASASIDSGAAKAKLEKLVRFTNEHR